MVTLIYKVHLSLVYTSQNLDSRKVKRILKLIIYPAGFPTRLPKKIQGTHVSHLSTAPNKAL